MLFKRLSPLLFAVFFLSAAPLLAAEAGHSDPIAPLLLGLVVLFASAKVGGLLAHKVHQPAVLGELLIGVLLGNCSELGYSGLEFIGSDPVIAVMAGLGVVLLLFEVGLESSVAELMRVGLTSTVVAVIGVIVPFIFGYLVSWFFLPEKSLYVHTFVGAALCATSVGITARVFKDLGKVHTTEAKIILGAAVIDDVLGLIILAVVSGLIISVNTTGLAAVELATVAGISAKAFGFLALVLLIGKKVAPLLFRLAAQVPVEGMLLSLSLVFCFAISYLASLVGLAPIVGAFAAGLLIDSSGYASFFKEEKNSIEHLIHPISKFFVPIFFVHMGMQVRLSTFADVKVLGLGLALTLVAVLGKQLCGLGVLGKKYSHVNKVVIGIGMIPRGEVGLIFAVIGASLNINGEPIIDAALYAAIVLMVMLTTMMTPPGLKYALRKHHE